MDKSLQPLIDQEYEKIADKMATPTALFGNSIDIGDLKQMVVAAYYIGTHETELRYENYRALDRQLEKATRKEEPMPHLPHRWLSWDDE